MIRKDMCAMSEIFYNVQFNKTCHKKYLQKLKSKYEKTDLDTFFNDFINCLMIPMSTKEKHPRVLNTLEFAANFAISLHSFDTEAETEQMCPFLWKLFDWLLNHHNAKDVSARDGICRFFNTLLNAMDADAFIDDNLCQKIETNMMDRMQDRSSKVRAQAVLALHRLQDPSNTNCAIIEVYIHHLLKDPSYEVRKAILSSMARNKLTLSAAIKKICDVHEDVRKMAYIFISKITVRSLTIEQREFILKSGLNDTSDKVKDCIKDVLLPSWLRNYNNDYISLLKGLDVENAEEMAKSCLQTLFKNQELKPIIDQAGVDETTREISINKLTSENVLFWRCLGEYLKKEGMEYFEAIVPELSAFCAYIKRYMEHMDATQTESWEHESQKFVLHQLFQMTKLYDLSDEMGRTNLRQLMLDTLLSKHLSDEIIKCLVNYMETVVPNVNERLYLLTHLIGELKMPTHEQQSTEVQITEDEVNEKRMKKAQVRVQLSDLTEQQYQAIKNQDFMKAEELKIKILQLEEELTALSSETVIPAASENTEEEEEEETTTDPKIILTCLKIMSVMLQDDAIKSLTPALRILVKNMVLPNCNNENDVVRYTAVPVFAKLCLLDGELAKKHLITFVMQLSNTEEEQNVDFLIDCLKSVIDLLHWYGLDHFNISQNETEEDKISMYKNNEKVDDFALKPSEKENNSVNIVRFLIRLLDSNTEDFRTIAGEGLCKLLLARRISSPHLLSRLIILLFNPISKSDVRLTQCLCNFLNYFARKIPESQSMLEAAFLPTLRTIEDAPDYSPLQEVDTLKVAKMILGLTRNDVPEGNPDVHDVHNNLVFIILHEIMNHDSVIEHEVLVKSLQYLNVQIEAQTMKQNLITALDKAEKVIKTKQKSLLKYFQQFRSNLESVKNSEQSANNANSEKAENDNHNNSSMLC